MNDTDRSALQRIRAALEPFFCIPMLLIWASRAWRSREETARERARAANRTCKAMFMTQIGPFTGPASYTVLGKELREGHKRPKADPKKRNS